MTPAISVVMSVFNNAPHLDEAITSILEQSFGDFEFLIVNDGSSDGSGEIVRVHAAGDARIRVLEQENRGLIASLNRAVAEARAPLIARMDGDDIALPTRFERQAEAMQRDPGLAVLGTQVEFFYEGDVRLDEPHYPLSFDAVQANLEGGPIVSHPTVMMRRSLVEAVGGYRPAFRHCEDRDLWLRLAERGRIENLPDVLHRYRVYGNQVSRRHRVEQHRGSVIAWLAHRARAAGRTDPTATIAGLPPLKQLDALLGPGSARTVRGSIAETIMYTPDALAGDDFNDLLDYVGDKPAERGPLWRTVLRLVRMGQPARAARLAMRLL